jgi:hypothetical protein
MTIGVVSLESSIVSMAIEVTTIPFAEMAHMLVRAAMSTAFRWVVLLVEWFHMVLAVAELPFAVLFLLDVVVQCGSLIKQRLIVGCIGH